MKKRYLILLTTVLSLCLLFMAVACNTQNSQTLSYSLNTDTEKGTVSYQGAEPSSNNIGKTVTMVIEPNVGFDLENVTINDVDKTADAEKTDGKYLLAFVVTAKLNIVVNFKSATTDNEIIFDIVDNSKYSVSFSSPGNSTNYVDGEQITATVTSKDGYYVTALKVNELTYPVRNGSSIIKVEAPKMTISPICKTVMKQKVLQSLCQNMKVAGSYIQDVLGSEDFDSSADICTVFSDEKIWQTEYNSASGTVYSDEIYGKNGNYITQYVRLLDNTIYEYIHEDLFEEYYNPFLLLKGSDFVLTEEGNYILENSDTAKSVAQALTGYVESIAEFTLSFENEEISLFIKTATIHIANYDEDGNDVGGIDYVATYNLKITELGSATIPEEKYTPYPTLPQHAILSEALENAMKADFYTVRHRGHELNVPDEMQGEVGYGDTDYNIYVVRDDIIYDSYAGEENGYKMLNGYAYPFFITTVDGKKEITLKDPVATDLSSLVANMTAFKVEFFKFVTTTDDGISVFTLQNDSYAPYFAPYFGEGVDEQKYYSYAKNLTVKVKDGYIYSIEITTATYGISEEIVLTYDFITDFSDILAELDFDNASKQSVLDQYKGNYRDDDGNFCKVDDSGFILNGVTVNITSYSSETGTFEGTWNGHTVYISKWSSQQLMILSEDYVVNYTLTNTDVNTTVIPDAYKGVWAIDNEKENLQYEFRIQTYAIWCNGQEMLVISYNSNEGISAVLNKTNYNFTLAEDIDGTILLQVIETDQNAQYVRFYAEKISDDAGIEIPDQYVGIYTNDSEGQKVVITHTKITVNGEEFVINSYSKIDGFSGILNSERNFNISFYYGNTDKLLIGTMENNYVLDRQENLISKYIGTWQSANKDFGENEKPYSYLFVITDIEIIITADYYVETTDENGETTYEHYTYENERLAFTFGDYGYAFTLNGSPYSKYILFGYNKFGNPYMVLYDNDKLLVYLEQVEKTVIPEEYAGTWRYVEEDTVYEAILSIDGTCLMQLGNGFQISVQTGVYSTDNNRFEFSYENITYFLLFLTDQNGNRYINLYSNSVINVNLQRVAEIQIPEAYYGTYKSTYGTKVEMIISEQGLQIKLNDGDFVTVYYARESSENYYVFTIDDVKYEIEANYGVDSFMLTISGETEEYAYMTREK